VNSSLTLRARDLGCANFRWWASQGALADQAGLCRDEDQMGLVSPSHLLAQRHDRGFSVLVLSRRYGGRRLSRIAVSIRWSNRAWVGWVLLNPVCTEIQGAEHGLAGGFDSARVVSRQRVLGRQAPVRPQGDIVALFELIDLGDQLVAQRSRGPRREDGFRLPGLVNRAVRPFAAGGSARVGVVGHVSDRSGLAENVGRIEVILAGNADQREQRVATGIGERRSHPMRHGYLADRADRPIGRYPLAGSMGQQCRQSDLTRVLIDGGGLDRSDLVLAKTLADDIQPARQGCVAECPVPLAGNGERIEAIRDFSGLVSSAWALARAAAMAPIDSLERCIGYLHVHQIKTDGAGFRAFCP
jgi:hypothetical protein